jgi:hypothetical protein
VEVGAGELVGNNVAVGNGVEEGSVVPVDIGTGAAGGVELVQAATAMTGIASTNIKRKRAITWNKCGIGNPPPVRLSGTCLQDRPLYK